MTRRRDEDGEPELDGDEGIDVLLIRPSRRCAVLTISMPNGSAYGLTIRVACDGSPIVEGPAFIANSKRSALGKPKAKLVPIGEHPNPEV